MSDEKYLDLENKETKNGMIKCSVLWFGKFVKKCLEGIADSIISVLKFPGVVLNSGFGYHDDSMWHYFWIITWSLLFGMCFSYIPVAADIAFKPSVLTNEYYLDRSSSSGHYNVYRVVENGVDLIIFKSENYEQAAEVYEKYMTKSEIKNEVY